MKPKRSKTKEYYRKTTTLKRTGISQYHRNLAVQLCAEGSYHKDLFCDIAKDVKFSNCAAFKKAVTAKKRRTAAESKAREKKLEEWIKKNKPFWA